MSKTWGVEQTNVHGGFGDEVQGGCTNEENLIMQAGPGSS